MYYYYKFWAKVYFYYHGNQLYEQELSIHLFLGSFGFIYVLQLVKHVKRNNKDVKQCFRNLTKYLKADILVYLYSYLEINLNINILFNNILHSLLLLRCKRRGYFLIYFCK